MEKAAEKLGWDIKVVDAGGDPGKAAAATQAFVNEGVDAIVLTSVDANLVRKQLVRAKEKNIPVIHTTSGTAPSDLWSAVYAEDETKMSSMLTQHIIDTVPSAKILDLKTTLNLAGSLRAKAVIDTVDASGGKAKIVGSSDVDLSNPAVNTQKDLTDLLTAHPEANAVHAVFDNMAQAAVTTVKLKRSKAKVFSYFTTENNVKNLRDGGLAAVMDNDLAKTGAVAFDQLVNYFEKKTPIDPKAMDKTPVEYRIIDKAGIEELGDDPFPIDKTLQPFLDKWAQDYPG
jgi:ABC-type sugar transport system substrate-binding protein